MPEFELRGFPPIAEKPIGYRYALEGELLYYGDADVQEFDGSGWIVVGRTSDGETIEEESDVSH